MNTPKFKWRELFSRREYLVLFVVILISLVSVALTIKRNYISPTIGEGTNQPTLIWRISDHTDNGTGLTNKIDGTVDDPRYDNSQVLEFQRKTDGSLLGLPRYQGTLEYQNP